MRGLGRWAVAVGVTVAAFVVPTWLCGAVALPLLLKDPAIRWGLASSLGVALAALAALWGHGFATESGENLSPDTPSVHAAGERSVAIHGNPAGAISTGDTGASRTPTRLTARQEPASPGPQPAPGTVRASGDRSIAISGNPTGGICTGDHHGEGRA